MPDTGESAAMSGEIPQTAPDGVEALAELRRLIVQLDRSGVAERDPEARRLIASSRILLAAEAPANARSSVAARRRVDGYRRLAQKFGQLGFGLWPLLPWVLTAWAAGDFLTEAPLRAVVVLGAAALLALLQRISRFWDCVYEIGFRCAYHAAVGRDWFVEAFCEHAEARLARKQQAFEVMAAWRRWSGAQPDTPGLDAVPRFLSAHAGPGAAQAFRAALVATPPTAGVDATEKRAMRRLARLRWSALMPLFEQIALYGPPQAGSATRPPMRSPLVCHIREAQTATDALKETVVNPELIARRQSLAEDIKRAREEINAVHNWRMTKPTEVAERDRHLGLLRDDLARLEAELESIGGVVPKPGARGASGRRG